LEELDRFLMSNGWEDIFPRGVVRKLPRELSDHNPLILATKNKTPLKHLEFRFELSWLKHLEFPTRVAELWKKSCHATSTYDRLQIKLKRFQQYSRDGDLIIWGNKRN
jgi:hypothetical protein